MSCIRGIQLLFCETLFLGILSWLLAYPLLAFSFFPGRYAFSFLLYPPPYLNLLRDTLSASDISLFLLYFFQWDTSLYPSVLSQLAWGYAVLFRHISFSLNFPLGIQFSFLLYPSTLSQLAQGYTTCTFTSQA